MPITSPDTSTPHSVFSGLSQQEHIPYNVYLDISNIIFSSLDIEIVLEQLVKYFAKTLNLSGIGLFGLDAERREILVLADTSLGRSKRLNRVIAISEELESALRKNNLLLTENSFFPQLYGNTHENPVLKQFFGSFWDQPVAVMLVPLFNSEDSFYSLTMYSFTCNAFSTQDLALCTALRQPLTMAFANMLEYKKLTHYKEDLALRNSLLSAKQNGAVKELLTDSSVTLRPLVENLPSIAQTDSTVLLLGETGVGKDLFATAIHQLSDRKDKPFVKVNCGAIPDSLIDSALFGHERGAFTGAHNQQLGYFEQAQNGTLFLDEIGELPFPAQARLLHVVQFREIKRVGSKDLIRLNIRIIAATHRDLPRMIRQGLFREDLWYRLNILPLTIPPLRQRLDDLPHMAAQIIRKKCMEMNIRVIPSLGAQSLALMQAYHWPGNVRELENMLERALILHRGAGQIEIPPSFFARPGAEDIQQAEYTLAEQGAGPAHTNATDGQIPAGQLTGEKTTRQHTEAGLFPGGNPHKETPPAGLVSTLDEAMAAHIRLAISAAHGKIQGTHGAAAILGLKPSTLRSKMKKLGITERA